jgi:hypothetical protein
MLENPSWGSSIMAITMIVSPLWILPRCMKLIPSKWAINPYLCGDFIFCLAKCLTTCVSFGWSNCQLFQMVTKNPYVGDSFSRLQKCALAISFWFPSCILPRDMSFWFALIFPWQSSMWEQAHYQTKICIKYI